MCTYRCLWSFSKTLSGRGSYMWMAINTHSWRGRSPNSSSSTTCKFNTFPDLYSNYLIILFHQSCSPGSLLLRSEGPAPPLPKSKPHKLQTTPQVFIYALQWLSFYLSKATYTQELAKYLGENSLDMPSSHNQKCEFDKAVKQYLSVSLCFFLEVCSVQCEIMVQVS